MKNFILSIASVLVFVGASAQVMGPKLELEKDVHDYGTIEQHDNGDCEFVFTNTGTAPLVISEVKKTCGCTVPSWPKEPIKPGATSKIKVHYDTKRIGNINKAITIYSNATDEPTKVIRIKGTITAAGSGTPVKEESGPIEK
jgi:hypothetical protein